MPRVQPSPGPEVQTLLREGRLTGDWVLDSTKSTIGLRTRHTWGLLPVEGAFGDLSGTGSVSSQGQVSGLIRVGAASLETKNSKRDEDLRAPRFFDAGRYPHIVVIVNRITPSTDGMTVVSSLTVRDVTRPLSFPIRLSVSGQDEVTVDGQAHSTGRSSV